MRSWKACDQYSISSGKIGGCILVADIPVDSQCLALDWHYANPHTTRKTSPLSFKYSAIVMIHGKKGVALLGSSTGFAVLGTN